MRDTETGLDYFKARYYASTSGRWMLPDWSAVPEAVPYADMGNPQTLNLYTYVGNNPITHTDVDGHMPFPITNGVDLYNPGDEDNQTAVSIGANVNGTPGAREKPPPPPPPKQPDPVKAWIRNHPVIVQAIILSTSFLDGGESLVAEGEVAAAEGAAVIGGAGAAAGEGAAASQGTAAGDTQPLVGNNPKDSGTRTNTDLPGGHDAATKTFDKQTAGQKVRTDPRTGHKVSEDGSRLRLNSDGKARVDLPNRGTKPNGETIHFNNPD